MSERYTARGSVLDEAKRITTGDRNVDYGPPDEDFCRSAGMLNALFAHKFKDGESFASEDIAKIQIVIKLSRSVWSEKRDHWTDICGYGACGYECIELRNGRIGEPAPHEIEEIKEVETFTAAFAACDFEHEVFED